MPKRYHVNKLQIKETTDELLLIRDLRVLLVNYKKSRDHKVVNDALAVDAIMMEILHHQTNI